MEQKQRTTLDCAMRYGTLMGVYWALKFVLFPIGFSIPILQILFVLLTLFVPILAYIFTKRYRDSDLNGIINFGTAFRFSLFMFMFASIFVAVIHFAYFRFIDNGYIFESYNNILINFENTVKSKEFESSIKQIKDGIKMLSELNPLEMTLQLFSQNLYYAIFISLPVALIVKRKK